MLRLSNVKSEFFLVVHNREHFQPDNDLVVGDGAVVLLLALLPCDLELVRADRLDLRLPWRRARNIWKQTIRDQGKRASTL